MTFRGYTPLHAAAWQGHAAAVAALLEGGAHTDVEAENGSTPLFWAERNGHSSVAQLLQKAQSMPDFVVTVCVGEQAPDGRVRLSCTSIGGTELAVIDVQPQLDTLAALWSQLAADSQVPRQKVRLALPDGRLLGGTEL